MEIFNIKSFPPFLFILLLLSQNPLIFIQKSCVPTQLRNTSSAISLRFSLLKTPFQLLSSKCHIIGSTRRSRCCASVSRSEKHSLGRNLSFSYTRLTAVIQKAAVSGNYPIYEPVLHFFIDQEPKETKVDSYKVCKVVCLFVAIRLKCH